LVDKLQPIGGARQRPRREDGKGRVFALHTAQTRPTPRFRSLHEASWDRFPDRKRPKTPIPHLAPDLIVEVLSKRNSKSEMKRKLREYFAAGVRLVWIVDPRQRTARVYATVDQSVLIKEGQSLDGGAVLPGFVLPLDELFANDES